MAGPLVKAISKGVGKTLKKIKTPKKKKTVADAARKAEGKSTADLTQPAGGSAGRTMDQSDAGIPKFKQDSFKTTQWDKALVKKEKRLKTLMEKYRSLKTKEAKEAFEDMNKSEILSLNRSIKNMKERKGPRINRKTGGQVMKKAGGGKMSHVGLYPAEEKRSGTMSEKKRAQNMGHGGKIKKYKHGGKVNTSRENRLEELGRVDAEKAHTKKGKRNLRQEKKRIVRELNGNDFVAQHYDS